MTDDGREINLDGGTLELGNNSVVERTKTWLGGKRRRHLPYAAITSVRVEDRYSWPLLVFGLYVTVQGAIAVPLDQVPLPWALVIAAAGVAVLAVAMLWTRQTIEIETASDDITKRGKVSRGKLTAFANGIEARV